MRRLSNSSRFSWLSLGALCVVGAAAAFAPGCKRNTSAPQKTEEAQPTQPSVRVFVLGGAAGAVEPCGCVKDMLGGVDHAAALVRAQTKGAAGSVVLGAGPMLFSDPELPAEERTQAEFKATAMARSLKDVGLAAWAPGANDWALGAPELARLSQESGSSLLAANLKGAVAGAHATRVLEVAGQKLGVVGVSLPQHHGQDVAHVEVGSAEEALRAGQRALRDQGAKIFVALVAGQRGDALRLAERVPGFQLFVLGKGADAGEANDPPFAPQAVGDALVVQAPNHLQGVAVVDLYVRDGSYEFRDGAGLAQAAERARLQRRIDELRARIAHWQLPSSGVSQDELTARKRDLAQLARQRDALKDPTPPKAGSYYTYQLVEVRESLGEDAAVAGRLEAYYKRVNEHNAQAFADRRPPPVPAGESGYVGIDRCSTCHQEERAFWDTTRHAHAYATLADDYKEFNLDCVSCHVTGYDQPGGSTVTHVEGLKDVQCEVCHGPGSRHADNPTLPDLITRQPATSVCSGCHHPPHVAESWKVSEAWPHILGKGHGR